MLLYHQHQTQNIQVIAKVAVELLFIRKTVDYAASDWTQESRLMYLQSDARHLSSRCRNRDCFLLVHEQTLVQ